MKTVVFLGPSLPLETARQHLDAVFLPPAAQGDLVAAIQRHRPDAVAIIDGVFSQSLSIWHKEILWALDQGILVFGASSMGALRALETGSFGMIGVGRVHQMYVDGEIEDDDEVAVLHGLPETGYRPLTVPMVNLRITFQLAATEGLIGSHELTYLIGLAKSMCFEERTMAAVFARARADQRSELVARIAPFVQQRFVDQKSLDAVELLDLLRTVELPVDMPKGFGFVRSKLFEIMYERDRKVVHAGQSLHAADIAAHAATHLREFDDLNRAAMHRGLTLHLADLVALKVTDTDVDDEVRRFRDGHRISADDTFRAWLDANDLDETAFRSLMHEEARCRALRRWLLTMRFKMRGVKLFLDEMRLQGRYLSLKKDAANAEGVARGASPTYDTDGFEQNALAALVKQQSRCTGMRMSGEPNDWLRDAGFLCWSDLTVSLLRAKLSREQSAGVGPATPPLSSSST